MLGTVFFHKQFFPSHPDSISLNTSLREVEVSVVSIKGPALQESDDISYNRTESSGTSGRQLKLTVSAFPTGHSYRVTLLTLPLEFSTTETRYYTCILNAHSV